MRAIRKSLPLASLLLLAVLVPVQAAGCCKWSAFLEGPVSGLSGQSPAAAAGDLAGGTARNHACCPKQAPPGESLASAPASPDCASGGAGCCLEDARATGPALASVPAAFSAGPAPILLLPAGESPRVAPLLPSRTAPPAAGPPPYLAHLRLLI